MRTWQETEKVFRRLAELHAEGREAAVAVIVHIKGSTYRRPGARLLIETDGTMTGNVSGGCLEQDVRQVAERVMSTGKPELAHYETGSDEDVLWGMGMGCEGEMDIFIQPSGLLADVVAKASECLAGDARFAISTVIEDGSVAGRTLVTKDGARVVGSSGDAGWDEQICAHAVSLLERGTSELHKVNGSRVFTDVLYPPPHLVICGAGDDAIPLVACASEMGFRVIVADHRSAYLARERFPSAFRLVETRGDENNVEIPATADTYVVVKTRALAHDRAWVQRFVPTDVPYIGLLGPKKRREKILGEVSGEHAERIYGPVGLDVGADGPEQVALSITAEILAVVAGRQPGHLREREAPIHSRV
jgi:xanthine/CO dehydrogenase XdhC/CoxF family maturation factor